MLKRGVVLVLVVNWLRVLGAQSPLPYVRETPFKGRALEGSIFLCKSDQVASAGYRFDVSKGSWTEVVDVSKQKSVTTWRVTFRADRAEVVAFTGATQILEKPTEFTVHRTPAGVLLGRSGQSVAGGGVFSEAITIDLTTSSFVYSGQDANRFMNKTNTLVGACTPYI